MGGMNLVVHAIVVVTIGVVTSRTVVFASVVTVSLFLQNKNRLSNLL